jgi:hypothetical protein
MITSIEFFDGRHDLKKNSLLTSIVEKYPKILSSDKKILNDY